MPSVCLDDVVAAQPTLGFCVCGYNVRTSYKSFICTGHRQKNPFPAPASVRGSVSWNGWMMVSDHQWTWLNTICLASVESVGGDSSLGRDAQICEEVALLLEGQGELARRISTINYCCHWMDKEGPVEIPSYG